jgi:hypothetical protein
VTQAKDGKNLVFSASRATKIPNWNDGAVDHTLAYGGSGSWVHPARRMTDSACAGSPRRRVVPTPGLKPLTALLRAQKPARPGLVTPYLRPGHLSGLCRPCGPQQSVLHRRRISPAPTPPDD